MGCSIWYMSLRQKFIDSQLLKTSSFFLCVQITDYSERRPGFASDHPGWGIFKISSPCKASCVKKNKKLTYNVLICISYSLTDCNRIKQHVLWAAQNFGYKWGIYVARNNQCIMSGIPRYKWTEVYKVEGGHLGEVIVIVSCKLFVIFIIKLFL